MTNSSLTNACAANTPSSFRWYAAVRALMVATACGAGLWGGANAQAIPWHLGSASVAAFSLQGLDDKASAAPSAINTASLLPGPHAVVVAVIDSGVIAEHPSLAGQLLPGYDMQSLPANVRQGRSANFAPDPIGTRCAERATSGTYRTHGTEVASLIAGNGRDGVVGVNSQAKIVPIRLLGACGMTRADMLDAISWAAGLPVAGVPDNPHPAQVINLSLAGGRSTCSPALQSLVSQVTAKGIIIVAAAGNNFHKPLYEPANCVGVISVGAVDAENRIEIYSALDPRTVMYAPGGGGRLETNEPWGINKLRVATYDLDFFGRERPNALDRGVGTSYASPVVAGFISLWLSYRPEITATDIFRELPHFLRSVEPNSKCLTCVPRSLAANINLIKP